MRFQAVVFEKRRKGMQKALVNYFCRTL